MRDERMKAAMFLLKPSKEDPALKPLDKEEITGIYRKAKILYEGSREW